VTAPSAPDHAATKSGDLVQLDYELWAEGGGRTDLIDTTREEVAQKAGVPLSEGQKFAPRPHLIGGEYFPAGIEAALVGLTVGEEVTKEFAPADAFGERDPKLIELFSMHEISRLPEMRKDDAHLDVGTVLNIRGRRGRVVTLTAARVRVDFNPAFAGRKVRATFKVLEKIHDKAEQVRALVDLTYGRGHEFSVEAHGTTITLKIPDRAKFDFAWAAAKPRVIDRIRTHLKPHAIHLVEEYVTPAGKDKEKDDKPAAPEANPDGPADASESPGAAKPAHAHAKAAAKD
jgi:FKBP-type peptidyl-prolyl cis-trans isomerase 2